MREFKVRGYAVEKMVNDQWLYGTGVHKSVYTDEYAERTGVKEEWFIYTNSGWEMVKPESIGQYTGLKDKNGKEIYEGDIDSDENNNLFVICYNKKYGAYCTVHSSLYQHENYEEEVIYQYGYDCYFHNCAPEKYLNIVGNIYENPELLQS